MAKLLFMGAQKQLFRGCRYVFPGEVVEMSEEEATVRKENNPNLWSKSGAAALEENQKVEPTKTDVEAEVKKVLSKTPVKAEGTKVQK